MRRRRHRVAGLPLRGLHRGGHQVVDEAAALDIADLVVGDLLEERGRQPHAEPTVHLTLDDHGVDDVAAVVDRHEAAHLDLAGALVDVHHADVAAERVGEIRRIVVADRLEPGLHPLRMIGVGREGDLLDRLGPVGRALHRELARLPHQVLRRGLEQVRGDLAGLVLDLARGHGGGGAGHRGGAARVGAEPIGRGIGVALLDLDVLGRDAELLGQDLSVGGLVPLALRLGAEASDGLAGGVDPDLAAVEHLEAQDVEVLGRAGAHDLGEARDADAHQLSSLTLLGLLAPQIGVADRVHGLAQGACVVAAVVLPAERRLVGELLRLDEVLHAELGGIHAELVGHDVHHALDRVHGLGHAEGAAVGDAARRLVGVGSVHLDVRGLQIVGPGADVEEPRRELGGVRGRVGVAVVGQRLDPQRGERAVLLGG